MSETQNQPTAATAPGTEITHQPGGGIPNTIASGRDRGQSQFAPLPPSDDQRLDVPFNKAYHNALLHDVNNFLESVHVDAVFPPHVHSNEDSLNKVVDHDALITDLSRKYKMRKSLIQCPILWEYRNIDLNDSPADSAVVSYYSYQMQLEAWHTLPIWLQLVTPMPQLPFFVKEDSSTGLGQIFANTAIQARNYAVDHKLINDRKLDPTKWHDMWNTWQLLHDNEDYNISTVPLVLIWGVNGAGDNRLKYSDEVPHIPPCGFTQGEKPKPPDNEPKLVQQVLARYNGTGKDAETYGCKLLRLYKVFEKYNAPARR